jgi:hypothetical protein
LLQEKSTGIMKIPNKNPLSFIVIEKIDAFIPLQNYEKVNALRDKRFIAEHRGGPLKKEQHRQLMIWACDCAGHILPLFGEEMDERLKNALKVAKDWAEGNASVGEARKASLAAILVARESSNPACIAVARAVGHAVATAHMADHSLGPAWYALKAVRSAGKSAEEERNWQIGQLPADIRELVLSAMIIRRI